LAEFAEEHLMLRAWAIEGTPAATAPLWPGT
jgi:hypothetical protein